MAANKKGLKDDPDNLKETAGSFASSAARSPKALPRAFADSMTSQGK